MLWAELTTIIKELSKNIEIWDNQQEIDFKSYALLDEEDDNEERDETTNTSYSNITDKIRILRKEIKELKESVQDMSQVNMIK